MNERRAQLAQIADDLETFVREFCPCSDDGKATDFAGEKCNDAFLMLQEALDSLGRTV